MEAPSDGNTVERGEALIDQRGKTRVDTIARFTVGALRQRRQLRTRRIADNFRHLRAVQVTYVTNGELGWLDSRYGRRL
jgi:hypothetical protein